MTVILKKFYTRETRQLLGFDAKIWLSFYYCRTAILLS